MSNYINDIERILNNLGMNGKMISGMLYKCEEYEKLDKEGRLHIAHIPDWSDIYVLYHAGGDFDEGECIIETKYKYGYTEFLFGEFNKGWFLTKEDAEKELKNQLK